MGLFEKVACFWGTVYIPQENQPNTYALNDMAHQDAMQLSQEMYTTNCTVD